MITVDVTGFYFRKTIPLGTAKTVKDVMDNIVAATANEFPCLQYESSTRPGKMKFLRSITARFDEDNPPRSRQSGVMKAERVFTYNDEACETMDVPGGASFALAWQYYVRDVHGRLKNSIGNCEARRIIPFADSDSASGGVTLEEGDVITWRLVAIFGSNVPADTALMASKAQPGPKYKSSS
ncbi:MAG: hypothetical protein AAFW83_14530 [Pseudomonadota bacterium]